MVESFLVLVELVTVLGVLFPALLASRIGFWFLGTSLSLGGYPLHVVFSISCFFGA